MQESEIILYSTPKGNVKIEIRFEGETFWLTQKKLAELFDVEVNTINYHLKEIFKTGELDENLLEAVIGLPANLFFGTGIPAAILIFNKAKGAKRDVLFIDASAEFESGKNQNKMNETHIAKVVAEFEKFKKLPALDSEKGEVLTDKFSFRATLKDIQDNEYNLNIPRYIDTFEEEAEVDIKSVHTEIVDLKQQLAATEAKMEQYLKELNLI